MGGRRITKRIGVYAIRHVATGRRYIGGSVDIVLRYTFHRFMLRRGCHKNIKLQTAWTRYGEDSFVFEIVEECSRAAMKRRETFWIQNTPKRYNVYLNADGRGKKLSKQQIVQMSIRSKRMWTDPKFRARQEARRGKLGRYGGYAA